MGVNKIIQEKIKDKATQWIIKNRTLLHSDNGIMGLLRF